MLGVVAVTLIGTFASSYQSVAARGLVSELRAFADAAALRPARQTLEAFSISYLGSHALASGGAVLIDLVPGGRVETRGSLSLASSPVVAQLLAHPPSRSLVRAATIGATPVELAAAPLREGSRRVGTIIVTADLTVFAAERSRVLTLTLLEASIALLAAVVGGYLIIRQLLRTVGRITLAADELGRSSLDQRLGDQGRDDEVGDLARTFDEMLDRIQAMMQAQRRLLADVSHQLRTPLTVARGHLEVLARTDVHDPAAVRDTIDRVVDEIAHMSAEVERLLTLGHAMDPEFLDRQLVDLRSLLGDCYAAAQVLAPRSFSLGVVPDLVLWIDEAKVRGAVLNLVANSVRATGPGDAIRLGSALSASRPDIEIYVEDAGAGIAPADRARVLERFARLAPSSTGGAGLGLAIVKAVAEAHGGRVDIGDSPLGGARVTLVLPTSLVRRRRGDLA